MQVKERGIILVPIDFTKQSLLAVKQSYNLAKYTHSKIILLHVYTKTGEESYDALNKLTKQTEQESGVPTEFMNVKGDIYEEVDRVAEEVGATLIIAGLESHMRFRNIMGSSASKLIRKAPCPVITIRGDEHRDGVENILLPLDLSTETREKVDAAVQFAQYFGASIRIIGVFDPADAAYENQLLAYSHQVKQFIKSKGISCTNKSIPAKDVAETVVEYANKIETDLIMIMNKPGLNVGEFFSGTDAQRIVDISNIPVMTLQPMKRESLTHFGTGF
ncbi:MAG: universal stress protein [Bacteroidota bacterium]|nr:universal stress protein [Bacteroidota bacterium]MDP3146089.1 universal stress protein [Bacteroidota bacterium]MDP3558625.1 universal stress protein [Bacteroidota bacterium]